MRTCIRALPLAAVTMLLTAGPVRSAGAVDLEVLFRAQMEMAASQLRMNPRDVDDRLALAAAATGITWQPKAGGVALFREGARQLEYTGWAGRIEGLRSAIRAGDARAECAFAISLVLDPAPDPGTWQDAFGRVSRYGDGFDTVLIGIISAPSKVTLLPNLQYAAADTLVWRADPRHTQFWLSLADSKDSYLRSRAVAAIGIIAYEQRVEGAPTGSASIPGLLVPVSEAPISAAQRRVFMDVLLRAAGDRSYRVRAAAALALGLIGGAEARDRLTRLVRDASYLVVPGAPPGMRRLVFPVREVAGNALQRFGLTVRPSGGDFGAREFRQATRGGRDVTRETGGMRKGVTSRVRFYEGYW